MSVSVFILQALDLSKKSYLCQGRSLQASAKKLLSCQLTL